MKRIMSLAMAALVVFLLAVNVFATSAADGEQYVFVASDGTTIHYYLDVQLNPYHYKNGEKVYLALGLSHLEVTDAEKIEELNRSISANTRAVPANYYDLSAGAADKDSPHYIQRMTFNGGTQLIGISTLKYNVHHAVVRCQTKNISKGLFSGTSINLIYYFYSVLEDRWYSMTYIDIDCRKPYSMEHVPNTYPYGRFEVNQRDNIKYFDFDVWTSWMW